MYDIRQFRPLLYILVTMGITGFALAAQSPGMWIVSMGVIGLNVWLVKTHRFAPVPRIIANIITVSALIYAAMARHEGTQTIIVIGQFLVTLQLVKLYEQRANRDIAQLLVLSLLLMVAAAISTASLEFGLLFITYLFLSLYCCLLFHLKVETDHARAVIGLPPDKLNPMTLRQDQRFLPRSMRRLAILLSGFAITMAVLVFLFFPRNTGAGMLGPMQTQSASALTGFNDTVNFQQVAQITQNPQIVAWVKLWDHGEAVPGTRPMYLRGLTLDVYTGSDADSVHWQWKRSPPAPGTDEVHEMSDTQTTTQLGHGNGMGTIRQQVILDPTGTESLFGLAGITSIRITSPTPPDSKLHYFSRDQTLRIDPMLDRRVQYEIVCDNQLTADESVPGGSEALQDSAPPPRGAPERGANLGRFNRGGPDDTPSFAPLSAFGRGEASTLSHSIIDPQIEQFARRPEVSGSDEAGPLAARRDKNQRVTALDEKLAANIAKYLRGPDFSYTLDLTDARGVGDRDPMVAFLYDLKRGHCEYFAGAMTLMCQSLGLQSRMVVGFMCDEYNRLEESYVVRQSQAHAWVEVLNDKHEWVVFDPTSGREAATTATQAGLFHNARVLIDYLEYTWANSVVAYDRESRGNLIQNVDVQLNNVANRGSFTIDRARAWLDIDRLTDPLMRANYSSKLVAALIAALLVVMAGAILGFLIERWLMRRRAQRIGLGALPRDEQLHLARQLGFYDELIQLLARHRATRPRHLTPREFSQTISFLPNDLFDSVQRLTEIFYRVRYGNTELSTGQQRRLRTVIARIESTLGGG